MEENENTCGTVEIEGRTWLITDKVIIPLNHVALIKNGEAGGATIQLLPGSIGAGINVDTGSLFSDVAEALELA